MSAIQKKRFKQLDGLVKKSFAEAAEALREIRDDKLFLDGGFKSFKEYCEHIELSYLQGYRMIESGKIAKEFPEVKNTATGLALSKVPPPRRREVVEKALNENGGTLSVPAIQRASSPIPARKPAPRTEPVKMKNAEMDKTGTPIPSESLTLWNRRDEIQHLLTSVSRIKSAIESAGEKDDALFRQMDLQGAVAKLSYVSTELKSTMPEYVCPECNGVMPQDCDVCKKRGLISSFWWNWVDDNKKKLRE